MNYPSTLIIVLVFFNSLAFAQSLSQNISDAFDAFEKNIELQHGIASLTVLNANTGDIVYAKNEKLGMSPASTLKTITAATAYSVLGSDFKYTTDLLYSGTIQNGILEGNIILKGTGDPSLGSGYFEQSKADVLLKRWTAAIKAAGIQKINGSIIGDDQLFNGQMVPAGWIWIDMGQYFGAGVSALNWRENKFRVSFVPSGKVGERAVLKQDSGASYLTIINEVIIGKSGTGDRVYAFSAPYSEKIILRGTYAIDLKKQIEISLPDGAYDAVQSLRNALVAQGISSSDRVTTAFLLEKEEKSLPTGGMLIDRYFSPTLSQMSYWFMKRSINMFGEAFLKTIALQESSDTETTKASEWEQRFWIKKLSINSGALKIKDGSGLAPENRITTLAMTKILSSIKKENWFGSYYENMPLYNNMKMKSGTIGGVLGYAGYQTTADGTPLVFTFLVNNYEGGARAMRLKMFKVLDALKR